MTRYYHIDKKLPDEDVEVLVSDGENYELASLSGGKWVNTQYQEFDFDGTFVYWTNCPKVKSRKNFFTDLVNRVRAAGFKQYFEGQQECVKKFSKLLDEKDQRIQELYERIEQLQQKYDKRFHEELVSDVLQELKDPKYQIPTKHEKLVQNAKFAMECKKREYQAAIQAEEKSLKTEYKEWGE